MVFQFVFKAIFSLAIIFLVVNLVKSLWPRVQTAWLAQVYLIQFTNTKYSSVNSVLELLHTVGNQLSQVDAWKLWRLQRRKVVKEEEELCQICHDNFHPGDEVFFLLNRLSSHSLQVIIPPCHPGHSCHSGCLFPWLARSKHLTTFHCNALIF